MATFEYTRLPSSTHNLRFVCVLPDEAHAIVRCDMYTWISDNLPERTYRALSYTWGDDASKVPIILNGKEFLVTANLEDALRHLRSASFREEDQELPLWIDAVCINQEDSDERDSQVRRMRSIYEQADHVIIWLGKYNEPTDGRFKIDLRRWGIGEVEDNSEVMARAAFVLALLLKEKANPAKPTSEISVRLEDYIHANNMQAWAQLSRLFNRPWFERLWIIQELAVSRQAIVLWGNLRIAWPTLEKAAKFILRPGNAVLSLHIQKLFPLLGAHRITQVALQSMLNVDTKNILTVLHNTQNTKCSDSRDRLFAILGVVDDTEDVDIDYSIPVTKVYTRWAQKRIKRLNTLDILSACADSSRGGDLPSWVPDLRRPFGQDRILWNHSQTSVKRYWDFLPSRFSMGRKHPLECTHLSFSQDGLGLSIDGEFLGKIEALSQVADVVTDLRDPADLTTRLRNIVDLWSVNSIPMLSNNFRDALLRDFMPFKPSNFELERAYDAWCEYNGTPKGIQSNVPPNVNQSRQETAMRDFERALFPRVHNCQMFKIARKDDYSPKVGGIVGGNCGAEIGDELWRLRGGLTPFILRRLSTAPNAEHRLISPCYLTGHMYPQSSSAEVLVTLV